MLIALAWPATGMAQESAASSPDRVQALEQELQKLRDSQETLKKLVQELRIREATPSHEKEMTISLGEGAHRGPGSSAPTPGPAVTSSIPIALHGTVTLRYDWARFEDQTDRIQDRSGGGPGNAILGFRARVRFLVEVGHEDDFISGGIRFTTGQVVNPAAPFITFGDSFRAKDFRLDHLYGVIRPIPRYRDRLLLIFGAAPNQFFRGNRGSFRSELIWDDDIAPEGVQIVSTFFKTPNFKIDNLAGYYILEDVFNLRFQGLTGPANLIADQFRVQWKWMSGAIAYYNYENLNSGLRTPTFSPSGQGIFLTTGQNAALFRQGLQLTNNHRTYGPGAEGFANDHMRLFNVLWQGRLPLPNVKTTAEIHLLVDYSYNFVRGRSNYGRSANHGYAFTLGITAGDWKGSWLHPFNLYITYRNVDADAVLATFADSDLGGGTQYYGVEVSWNYRITRHLLLNFSAFRFRGYPNKDVDQSRIYGDVVFDF